MNNPICERRKYERYNTKAEVYFSVVYDIKTKVKFRLLDKDKIFKKRYFGLTKDISVEGMRFSSDKKLKIGDNLYLEVYLPKHKEPICMTGEVRWSRRISVHPDDKYKFDTGVRLITVLDKPVSKTVHYDKEHQVYWSIALDSVFGEFRKFMQEKRKRYRVAHFAKA